MLMGWMPLRSRFLLADNYLVAAKLAATASVGRSTGPVRLMAYHAAELFL
jgi:hypothetical protein